MANVLDLRRRIRSVKNTRQITKAMKMVSAAKLRRAQERAISARPYAKMITSVLESLTRRIDIFDPATGNLLSHSAVLLAVSQSADPTGGWNVYSLDTTNNTGTPDHQGCPCFGDQPLIGADANGFYITTNEFPIAGDGFNGAQVYAISKAALAASKPSASMRTRAVCKRSCFWYCSGLIAVSDRK